MCFLSPCPIHSPIFTPQSISSGRNFVKKKKEKKRRNKKTRKVSSNIDPYILSKVTKGSLLSTFEILNFRFLLVFRFPDPFSAFYSSPSCTCASDKFKVPRERNQIHNNGSRNKMSHESVEMEFLNLSIRETSIRETSNRGKRADNATPS